MVAQILNFRVISVTHSQRQKFKPFLINRFKIDKIPQSIQALTTGSAALNISNQPPMVKSGEKFSKQLLLDALKLPIYSVGIIPVLVGGAVAYYEHGTLSYQKLLGLMLAGCLVIGWLNLSNDAFDSQTGVDDKNLKPESVVQIIGSPWLVLTVAKFLLLCGVTLLLSLITAGNNFVPAYLLTCSICMGYIYQGPPFRLSYKGLGEPLCFFAFGPFATCAFYLTLLPCFAKQINSGTNFSQIVPQILQWVQNNGTIFGTSILVGLTTTSILLCSHFHQIEGDKKAGKMSPLVQMGPQLAYKVLSIGVVGTYVLGAIFCAVGWVPLSVFGVAVLGSLWAMFALLDFGRKYLNDPVLIKPFKKYAAKWHILFNVSVCIGFVVSKLINI